MKLARCIEIANHGTIKDSRSTKGDTNREHPSGWRHTLTPGSVAPQEEIRGDEKGAESVGPVRRDHHPWRPGAQSTGHRPRPTSRSPGRLHGGQRFGE